MFGTFCASFAQQPDLLDLCLAMGDIEIGSSEFFIREIILCETFTVAT